MLFQMCYGPEIRTIFECINRGNASSSIELKSIMQYQDNGDISSLIDGVIVFLKDIGFIEQKDQMLVPLIPEWSPLQVLKKLKELSSISDGDSLNYIFTNIHDRLFVKPNRMFLVNIHYHVNSCFPKTMVGHEKINAWKRVMEYMGVGRRVYSGFYALPQLELIKEILREVGTWEGGLHPFCEKYIDPVFPCITSDSKVYNGILFALVALSETGFLKITHKQDLPYKSYGPNFEWNWIEIGGENS